MAVQVLEYHQGFLNSQQTSDGGGGQVMATSLQNMQHIMNLLSENQMRQAQDAYSHIADAATSDLKKVFTLSGGLGHARFRHAPRCPPVSQSSSPASLSSTPLFQMSPLAVSPANTASTPVQMPSSSTSLHVFNCLHQDVAVRSLLRCNDATEPSGSNDLPVPPGHSLQPDSEVYRYDNNSNIREDVHHVHKHVSMQTKPAPQHDSSCHLSNKEQNVYGSVYDSSTSHPAHVHGHARCREAAAQKRNHQVSTIRPLSTPLTSSFVSSMSVEEKGGTVSSGKPVYSSGRPPLPPKKRIAPEEVKETGRKCRGLMQCHCAHKRRKLKSRTNAMVSAIGVMGSDIPADGYSWCTYGRKFVEGSTNPRVYYKCSSVRGCPARKHVQRAAEDPNIFLVTYGRRHTHPQIHKVAITSEGDNVLF